MILFRSSNTRFVRYLILIPVLMFLPVFAEPAPTKAAKGIVSEAALGAPADGEVCFSPEDSCDVKLGKFIQSAAKSVDMAIFDLNLEKIFMNIIAISKKIPVRVLVDRRQSKLKHSLMPRLIKAGINVRYGHQKGLQHNKFTIVDGRIVQTGSFNYTNGAAFKNNENQVYLANPAIVEQYKKRFEKIWMKGDMPK
ncbi:MAG: hypothetical protein A2583_16655 [Bdellovibrionales bacterium RIFOXYD1_FULL_53_11]|nr:MAG: hypothetical protein A2583_16655 [Bdellovibrionales bacterium RIFOXYD1_FULL_53_11]